MRRFSPALVLAALALFIALAGTATAGAVKLITGAQIKNGSIQLVDLSPAAKAALKGQRGPQGIPGAQGLPGTPGSQGIQGAPGANGVNGGFDPAKVSYVYGAEVEVLAGEDGQAIASCPAGAKVTGGGMFFAELDDSYTIVDNGPLSNGSGWSVIVANGSADSSYIAAYAVCAAK